MRQFPTFRSSGAAEPAAGVTMQVASPWKFVDPTCRNLERKRTAEATPFFTDCLDVRRQHLGTALTGCTGALGDQLGDLVRVLEVLKDHLFLPR